MTTQLTQTDSHRRSSSFVETARCLVKLCSFRHMRWRHHGLGMLQSELSDTLRIHVWSPELRTIPETNLRCCHDHRFDLESAVVAGSIIDTPYIVLIGAQPYLATSRYDVGFFRTEAFSIIHAKEQNGVADDCASLGEAWAKELPSVTYNSGTGYRIARRDWHTTRVAGVTVTVVYRSNFDDKPARVLGYGKSGIVRDSDLRLARRVLEEAYALVHS
jgi:hypothetical protein